MEVCVVDGLLNFKRTFTRSTMYMILRFVFRPGVYRTDTFFCDSLQKPRADPDGGATRAIVSPKICGSIFFHNEFVQFAGHYLQYKDILPSIVLSQQCCEVFRSEVPSGYAQSFAPWQQATIEIMLAISLTIACSRNIYNGVTLHAHPVRGESHNQRNATGEAATLPSLPALEVCVQSTVLLRQSHTIKCYKLFLILTTFILRSGTYHSAVAGQYTEN